MKYVLVILALTSVVYFGNVMKKISAAPLNGVESFLPQDQANAAKTANDNDLQLAEK